MELLRLDSRNEAKKMMCFLCPFFWPSVVLISFHAKKLKGGGSAGKFEIAALAKWQSFSPRHCVGMTPWPHSSIQMQGLPRLLPIKLTFCVKKILWWNRNRVLFVQNPAEWDLIACIGISVVDWYHFCVFWKQFPPLWRVWHQVVISIKNLYSLFQLPPGTTNALQSSKAAWKEDLLRCNVE